MGAKKISKFFFGLAHNMPKCFFLKLSKLFNPHIIIIINKIWGMIFVAPLAITWFSIFITCVFYLSKSLILFNNIMLWILGRSSFWRIVLTVYAKSYCFSYLFCYCNKLIIKNRGLTWTGHYSICFNEVRRFILRMTWEKILEKTSHVCEHPLWWVEFIIGKFPIFACLIFSY